VSSHFSGGAALVWDSRALFAVGAACLRLGTTRRSSLHLERRGRRLCIQQRRRFAAEKWDAKGLACPTLSYERAAALPATSRLRRGKQGVIASCEALFSYGSFSACCPCFWGHRCSHAFIQATYSMFCISPTPRNSYCISCPVTPELPFRRQIILSKNPLSGQNRF
jgi:hypothetical protein